MGHDWTDAQRSAIDERKRTLLVSAAAGSGKTAVLTERIIRSLTDEENPMDITRMLIVTFTKAAANQLRQKISSAIGNALMLDPTNKHLSHQLMMLGGAHISTIDSFYLDVVKANFQAADFPPRFRMAEESELSPMRKEIMEDTIAQMYEEDADFSLIADIFADVRNEGALTETLISIAQRLDKLPESIEILLRSARELEQHASDPLETGFGKIFLRSVEELATTGATLLGETLDAIPTEDCAAKLTEKYVPHYTEVMERCRSILALLAQEPRKPSCFEDLCQLLKEPFSTAISRARPKPSQEFEKKAKLCALFLEKFKKTAPVWGANSPEEVEESAFLTAKVLRLLHKTLTAYQTEYARQKKLREIAEFSDVSRAAYKLLVGKDGEPTALARELSGSFDAIYIDEYQDVDAMQDATFRAISTPTNRFMVGDIKQSIYRFRGAQPTVFAGYRKAFPPIDEEKGGDNATVFMSNCFRCDNNVIHFSNAVSSFLFSRSADSIGYSERDDLVFSKDTKNDTKCRVMILEKKSKEEQGDDDMKGAEAEALMIAKEIERMLANGKRANGARIQPGDIAILGRSTTRFPLIAKALAARGIPVSDTSKQSFFENPEVLCTFSLLAAIDNPHRDIYLAATLRSPFFGFTLEELVKIRALADGSLSLYEALCCAAENGTKEAELDAKIADFLTRLGTYREKAKSLPVDKLLRYLYRENAILSLASAEQDENGHLRRRSNLNRLYEYARTFEANGFKGLYQFVRYVSDVMNSEAKLPQPEGAKNAVLLSTIHGSKGLEFPICFLISAASRFNEDDFKSAMLTDEHLGCATRLPNAGPFSRYNTFWRKALECDLRRQNREEEMRVLYVGMTRAIEQLIVTASLQGSADTVLKKAELRAENGIGELAFGGSYLAWILAALERGDTPEFVSVEIMNAEDLLVVEDKSMDENEDEAAKSELTRATKIAVQKDDSRFSLLQKRFAFTYPHAHLSRLPAKLSVSKLSPVVLDVYDNDAISHELLQADAERLLHTFEREPIFGEKAPDAAARGTATHEFLQFCDFARVEKHGVAEELARLTQEKFISSETAAAVRIDELERFFKSGFYQNLSHATEIHRETRFNIFLPAADFTLDADFAKELEGEHLLVQGVIDLFYTDAKGQLVLCDYKTDRLSPAELKNPALAAQKLSDRHGEQLSYYAKALGEICGKEPDRILIYSLPLGEAVEVILPK